ncbi:MAG: YihY/virulence factor BrkB family protein [Desulfomicrobium escambiense]|nr:YihY/virulence factor BrkB family protein [Desulfomicrobium escambiense]
MLLLGHELSLKGSSKILLYLLGMGGMVLMLTSFYLVMPVGRISFRHALSGAVTATVLWEIIRRLLVWYYSKLSLVNVIYGSLATTVVALLSIEVAVIILLLGAQVISEFDRRRYETGGHRRSAGRNQPHGPPAPERASSKICLRSPARLVMEQSDASVVEPPALPPDEPRQQPRTSPMEGKWRLKSTPC